MLIEAGILSEMDVHIPQRHQSAKKPFEGLLHNAEACLRAGRMFEKALRRSFEQDERRHGKAFRERVQTATELKRRAEIMARWFRVFRGELGYSLSQCELELGGALRSELDGTLYTPYTAIGSYGVPEGETR